MKHKFIIICLLPILALTSCGEDWLTVKPSSNVNLDGYYKTEARIYEAVVATYDPLHWLDYAWGQYTNIQFVSDIMGDDLYVGGSDETDCAYLHRMFNYTALPTAVTGDLWTMFYSGINRANNVVEHMPKVVGISDKNRNLYLSEAIVLRSFYYNWLWKFWGNIVYYNKNLTLPYTCAQYKADEVYSFLIKDLEEVLALNALPMKQTAQNYGRVTKAMAYMLYTEIVMYQKDESRYAKALGYMQEIINSKEYDLNPNFKALWEVDGEWGIESIFEINYFNANGGKDWGNALIAGGTVFPKFIGVNGLSGSGQFDSGWGFGPLRSSAYTMYSNSDNRREGTVYRPADNGATYSPRYQDTGNFLYKSLPRIGGNANCSASPDMNYNNNVRIYRFSETLLNAAELIARGTPSAESAQTYLNRVRARAGLSTISASIDNIIEERHLEFVGEGKRYWDLIRTGKASSVLVADGMYRVNTWSENKKYLPIPQAEIDSTSGSDAPLTQNSY